MLLNATGFPKYRRKGNRDADDAERFSHALGLGFKNEGRRHRNRLKKHANRSVRSIDSSGRFRNKALICVHVSSISLVRAMIFLLFIRLVYNLILTVNLSYFVGKTVDPH